MAFAESRIRQETIAAEDILHDMGESSSDVQEEPVCEDSISECVLFLHQIKKKLAEGAKLF